MNKGITELRNTKDVIDFVENMFPDNFLPKPVSIQCPRCKGLNMNCKECKGYGFVLLDPNRKEQYLKKYNISKEDSIECEYGLEVSSCSKCPIYLETVEKQNTRRQK
ncbi:hypothetical protein GF326_08050 [Candidatus Bathyarchaeota archaeon]|nr:hypothetical protein [Candidatus Bathyarchaeota archaeon]